MIKISFTGDIMCYAEQISAIEEKGKDYNTIFSPIKDYFQDSDYVVANLETPIAGAEMLYTTEPASFNTPSNLLNALSNINIKMVTNANNHILDRGIDGLLRTIEEVDQHNLEHTGCYEDLATSEEIFIKNINGVKVAILSFTYGTNSEFNGNILPEDKTYMVDLLKKQSLPGQGGFQRKLHRDIWLDSKNSSRAYKLFHLLYKINSKLFPYKGGYDIDTVKETEINNPANQIYLNRFVNKLHKAHSIADITVLCLHCGGQYNDEIGLYTKHIFNIIKQTNSTDIVIGNHPHCVQNSGFWGSRLYTYSLGNFSFTPGGKWYINTVHAEYSIVLHCHIDSTNKKIIKYTYSIFKNIIDKDGISRVYNTFNLYKSEIDKTKKKELAEDIRHVVKRFTKKNIDSIQKEYHLKTF